MSMTPDQAWDDVMTRPLCIALCSAAAYTVAKTEFMDEFGIVNHEDIESKLGADFARFINRMDKAGEELLEKKVFGNE
jgi:hypothetical protein